jgi:hypothetical protein
MAVSGFSVDGPRRRSVDMQRRAKATIVVAYEKFRSRANRRGRADSEMVGAGATDSPRCAASAGWVTSMLGGDNAMRLLIVGAGASRGSIAKEPSVPTAAEFGKALARINRDWQRAYQSLAKVVTKHLGCSLDQFSLEELWTCVDWYAKFKHVLPKPAWEDDDADAFGPQLKRALLEVYGGRCDALARALPRNDGYVLGRLLGGMRPGDVIASFNYDTIVERLAIETFGLNVSSVSAAQPSPAILLVKPHGSVSWAMNVPTRSVRWHASSGEPLLDSLTTRDIDRGTEPLLLGAVPIKSELIFHVQAWACEHGTSWKQVFDLISKQWSQLVHAIRHAQRISVVGYSFPREDVYGRFLIGEAARSRLAPVDVEFFELEARARDQSKEIYDAFARRVASVTYMGPVTSPGRAAKSPA